MRSGDTLHNGLPPELPQFLPDALKDNTRSRNSKANRRKGYGQGLLSRLVAATDSLSHVMLPLWRGPGTDLYDPAANRRARDLTAAAVGNAAAWVKLEYARPARLLHAHLIVDSAADLMLPHGSKVVPVHDLEGLARYLAKPADSGACRVRVTDPTTGRTLTTTGPDPDQLLAAYHDHLRGRARAGQLPRTSWTHNLPFLRANLERVD